MRRLYLGYSTVNPYKELPIVLDPNYKSGLKDALFVLEELTESVEYWI